MKIAVVGCGAVGSFYGALLARAGHDLHFLLRSDFEVVLREGTRVLSPWGNFTAHPKCARTAEEIGVSEVVVIALKTTANEQFPKLVAPLVSSHTRIVTLQNGLGNEEQLARWFAPDQIFGGLCFVCLNRTAPGLVRHLDHGHVVIGPFRMDRKVEATALAECLAAAGVPCTATGDLARAHWEKLTWNIPFNGLGVAGAAGAEAIESGRVREGIKLGPCVTTDILLADPRWFAVVRSLIKEVIAAARADGSAVEESLAETQIARTRTMGAYRASTLIDFERGLPLELDALFLEPLRRARTKGLHLPCLEKLCSVLVELEMRNRGRTAQVRP